MSYRLIRASAHDTGLPSKSVHMICTSPPYYGLRSYHGEQAIEWESVRYSPMAGLPPLIIPAMICGLGEEESPEAFIGHLILVMREMWRVLRDDGTCWVNLGDSYAGSGGAHTHDHANPGLSKSANRDGVAHYKLDGGRDKDKGGNGIKPKDMMMIPARFALAAQADGWYVRQDIIWQKLNPMPESVTDRCTKAHEYIYLLAKSEKYFYDADAVREQAEYGRREWSNTNGNLRRAHNLANEENKKGLSSATVKGGDPTAGRNRRSVWTIATSPYPGSHFATFPPALVEIMIKAGSSAYGCCPSCAAPWKRNIEHHAHYEKRQHRDAPNGVMPQVDSSGWKPATVVDHGWQPTCNCDAGEPIPATVLDCFNGSGTSGKVALQLGRSYIGIDVSQEYLTDLAPQRMSNIQMEMSL